MSRVLKILLGGSLVTSSAFAQPTPPAPAPAAPAPVAPAPDATGAAGTADIGVRARATLTPQEMLEQSRSYRARILEIVNRIQAQVDQATKQKDIIRVNCLTDKLVQARAHLAIADQATGALEQAVGRADEGATIHEYTRATIVSQKAQVLASEADQCVGEDLAFVGATRVDVDVDPGVRTDDPTQPIDPAFDPVGTRPETQSPSE